MRDTFDAGGIASARPDDSRLRIERAGKVTVRVKRWDAVLPEERARADPHAAVDDLAAHGLLAQEWTPHRS